MPSRKRTGGFTLIELIISIAIIALAFGFLLSQFGGVLERGRDDRRLSDVTQLRHALSLYSVNRGRFPVSAEKITLTGEDAVSRGLVYEEAIPAIPRDPLSPDQEYAYQSNHTGTTYTLSFCLETADFKPYAKGCGNSVAP